KKEDFEERHKEKGKAKEIVKPLENKNKVEEEGSEKDEWEQIIIQAEELTQKIRSKHQRKQIEITEQLFQILGLKPVQSTSVLEIQEIQKTFSELFEYLQEAQKE
ncbi:4951_t:CDS:1, partial [Ambispora gerdemannii]